MVRDLDFRRRVSAGNLRAVSGQVCSAVRRRTRRRPSDVHRVAGPTDEAGPRLRLLHLAFEDYRKPGSGGGSLRTHEVNRRLACRHSVTVVTARYPGAEDRVEDGVEYRHVGVCVGYFGSILTYFAVLPRVLRQFESDLVIEEFAAPFSSVLVPLWTRKPTIAMVQWLFAREKSKQYHLPFFLVERLGVQVHRHFIALSADLGDQIATQNPRARIEVLGMGVDAAALATVAPSKDRMILFLGRLEVHQKGLDMLLDIVEAELPADFKLVVAGDGRDAERFRMSVQSRMLSDSVEMVGRVAGQAKFDLLASAQLLCMPSRYETFGLTALEALACGTPVLAFGIPCLRETIPSGCGILVEPFDTSAYGERLRELLADADRCAEMGRLGRAFAAGFSWDAIAAEQGAVYERVVWER